MSENNKDIIESAFSFSEVEYLGLKRKPNTSGKFIKTWKITQKVKNEEDETQFKEETEYKEPPIAIQEEYETYGTVKKLIAIDQNLTKFFPLPLRDETVLVFASFL